MKRIRLSSRETSDVIMRSCYGFEDKRGVGGRANEAGGAIDEMVH